MKRLTRFFVIMAFCSCSYTSSASGYGSDLKVDYIPAVVFKEYCTEFGNISSESYDVVEALNGAIEKAKGYPEARILAITNITKLGGKTLIEAKAARCLSDYKLQGSAKPQFKAKKHESERKKFIESQPVEIKCFIDGGIPIKHGSESECMFM
jgi:hypothetical protein